MFSGLIQQLALLQGRETADDHDLRLKCVYKKPCTPILTIGDSICINGVCLSACTIGSDYFIAEVSKATQSCTTLGDLEIGAYINMECSLLLGAPLGGHFVSGHVDSVAYVQAMHPDGGSVRFDFGVDEDNRALMRYIVAKGSVAIDGVSLTVNTVHADGFCVNIIAHTLEETLFQYYQVGTAVNLEVDMMARYIEGIVSHRL